MSVSSKSSGITSNRWFKPVAVTVGALVIALILVLVAQWLRTLDPVKQFLTDYPGHSELPEGAPTGLPAWLGWQHFLNMFFIVLIIRSGWQVRTTTRPPGYWTRNNKGFIKTRNAPTKISLDLWFHLTLDALWVLNGLIFIVLLFATGQWMRIVPTSWDVFPNAVSAGLQYASLNWPLENGWVNYNALQLLTYFITVFIAAPLAIITGIRMSGAWPKKAAVNKFYPIEAARKVHFPVMIYFVAFVIVHVTLVLATGALRNLNHMYASTDDANSWWGFAIFAASIVVTAAAWFLARPLFLRPIASLMGKVTNR
ncbi:cytochrome b/b6 domain-containing protein [Paenarthrobacter ureafaciens]|uniref:cytochrome b/b6 domain-containing protein n=1 Tax=Paenarthrobacter ureafaciens TaxID=37931 RepID=UPI00140A9B5E|nr:cytochrome b/b6 domain-containing protein [Paenarthrobacter ureafaciens]MCX8454735.1 cytochrome b/b6 domain-containing protein [Paenarthrobacter ureafaciens]MCY0973541.1 cytochrome b/b6 domain-containing protein [Paenarthrobacter ureafaciens]